MTEFEKGKLEYLVSCDKELKETATKRLANIIQSKTIEQMSGEMVNFIDDVLHAVEKYI